MYLLVVSYSQAPAKVEPHIPPHGTWVKQYIESGTFLFAGPKKSGLGGVILVKSMPKSELQKLLAEDSYVKADVVDYQIVDFDCKLAAPELSKLLSM
ncbi:MAG TPA: YciI family protein [Steroidobacteraceae bacterium]